ncbi:MAG: response regulator transcription factor [Syntrophobacteraceae bacterium]
MSKSILYRLLVIDDVPAALQTMAACLRHEGFELTFVLGKRSLPDSILTSLEDKFDLVLLGLEFCSRDGFEALRILNRQNIPAIVLADCGRKSDCILALEEGAHDYLLKPVDLRELLAKSRAVLRRSQRPGSDALLGKPLISLADIEMDCEGRIVRLYGKQVRLTCAEFNFLAILLRAAGNIVSREKLARSGLGRDLRGYDRSIDMVVSRLRKKLGNEHHGIERIKTIRGAGFIYTIPSPNKCVGKNFIKSAATQRSL